jgi:hypothetical protein
MLSRSVNKCMEYVGRAYRTSTIRAHPTKKGYTLIEQGGGVEVNTNVPGALRGPIENFACGSVPSSAISFPACLRATSDLTSSLGRAFIDVCKQALDKLNVTLHRQSLRTGSPTATEPVEEAASSTTTSGEASIAHHLDQCASLSADCSPLAPAQARYTGWGWYWAGCAARCCSPARGAAAPSSPTTIASPSPPPPPPPPRARGRPC